MSEKLTTYDHESEKWITFSAGDYILAMKQLADKDALIEQLQAKSAADLKQHLDLVGRNDKLQGEIVRCEKEAELLVFKMLRRDALLIANEIDLPDDTTVPYLPECKWQTEGHRNRTLCDSKSNEHYGQPCSERCACSETEGGE